jgi:hypothetical protein
MKNAAVSVNPKVNRNPHYFIHGYELEVLQSSLYPLSIKEYEEFSEKMCFTENVMEQGERSPPKITLNMSFAEEVLGWVIFRVSNSLEKRRWGSILRATEIMKKPPYERKGIDEIYDSAVSRSAYILLGMKPNENLVFGHTHRPFINKERTVANTGSWVKELSSQNTYIDISEGKMELKIFK